MKTAETSIADVIGCLRQYSLLDAPVLERLAKEPYADAKALVRDLVQKGLLTPFQANRVMNGRGQELVMGNYQILDLLGAGGMGAVYKARHPVMGRIVALKVIRPERLQSTHALRRFRREIEAAAKLDHPNIVQALDANEVDGTLTLVMEYVDGTDLAKIMKEKGPLPVDQATDYICQAATGLQHAHEKGLVHRDIKPQNLLLTKEGVVKILDMGLARQLDADQSVLTREGAVVGTPDYVAPEQVLNSHNVDIRADIYSLGATFYTLLTGKVPFPGGNIADKLVRQQKDEPPAVEALRPQVGPALAQTVRRMMAKNPDERFQTPALAAFALRNPGAAPQRPIIVLPPTGSRANSRKTFKDNLAQLGQRIQGDDWIALLLDYRWWVLGILASGLAALIILISLIVKFR